MIAFVLFDFRCVSRYTVSAAHRPTSTTMTPIIIHAFAASKKNAAYSWFDCSVRYWIIRMKAPYGNTTGAHIIDCYPITPFCKQQQQVMSFVHPISTLLSIPSNGLAYALHFLCFYIFCLLLQLLFCALVVFRCMHDAVMTTPEACFAIQQERRMHS